ncbi:MAG: hypothetical protein ABIT69_09145, partial [Sphingomicrobium sp.]
TLTAAVNGLTLTQTVTDADGDHAAATIDLSAGVFSIQDAGPTTFIPDAATVINNDSAPFTGFLDTDHIIANNLGSDGGTVRFSVTDGSNSGMTSGGSAIIYHVSADGQTLYGDVGPTHIFTVTINQAASTYTLDMNGTIDSTTTIDFNNGSYTFLGGNDPWAGFNTAPDDNSKDLLLTPLGASGSSINGNANSAGAGGGGGGQNIGSGEGIRLDFVVDLGGNPAGSPSNYQGNVAQQDHTFDSHYLINNASVTFGDGANNSTVSLKAILATDNVADSVLGNGALVSVSSVAISFDGDIKVVAYSVNPQTVTVGSPNGLTDRTYTVQFVTVGAVHYAQVTGVLDTNVSIATIGASQYNALEVQYQSGDSFALTDFGVAAQSSAPVHFNIPVQIVDGDGDIVAGTAIAVTANMAPPIALDTNHDGTISYLGTDAGVVYDMNHDGAADHTAWVAAGDSILVRDADGNGTVTDASEFVFGGAGVTDMEALHAQYGDQLDASDAGFVQFMVWNDANSNGIADAGELQSLTAAGITSISLVSDGVAATAANGDVQVAGSTTFTYVNDNGQTVQGKVDDAAFAYKSGENDLELRLAGTANSGVVAAAVAAMGLAAGGAASHADSHADHGLERAAEAGGLGQQAAARSAVASAASTGNHSLIGGEHSAPAVDATPATLSSAIHAMAATGDHSLNGAHGAPISQPAALLASAAAIVDTAHSMVNIAPVQVFADAGAKASAAVAGGVQHGGVVAKVLAEAVEHGAPSIDAVLAHLPANGAAAALQALASHGGDAVPAWDNGHFGGFTPEAIALITTEAMVLHHDAVQPAVNG